METIPGLSHDPALAGERSTPWAGTELQIQKLKADGTLSYSWTGEVVRCDSEMILLRALFNRPFVDLGYTSFREGDIFFEVYYWNRWYNVFQISHSDGALKGWYANLGKPAVLDPTARILSYVDLALDVWANPDGSYTVLDEDEYEDLVRSGALAGESLQRAEQGRRALLELAEAAAFPRWPQAPAS